MYGFQSTTGRRLVARSERSLSAPVILLYCGLAMWVDLDLDLMEIAQRVVCLYLFIFLNLLNNTRAKTRQDHLE